MAEPSAHGPRRPDKVLWPAAGLTKQDLWDYVEAVGPRLLEAVAGRPLTLKRFPDGLDGQGWFQKDLPASALDHIDHVRRWSPSARREVTYAVARTPDHLRWLADQAALELHPMLARAEDPDAPDALVLDLDPPANPPAANPPAADSPATEAPDAPVPTDGSAHDPTDVAPSVAQAAHWVRAVLDRLDLPSRVKTSGKSGLHLVVPVAPGPAPARLRALALAIGRAAVLDHPRALTVEMRKERRRGRLLVDWSRSSPAQSVVAAWSPRATPLATVATPLDWAEVTDELDPTTLTLRTAPHRRDPWAERRDPVTAAGLDHAEAVLAAEGIAVVDRSPRSSRPVEDLDGAQG